MVAGWRFGVGALVCGLVVSASAGAVAAPPGPDAGPDVDGSGVPTVPVDTDGGALPLDRGVVEAVDRDLGLSWDEFAEHGEGVRRASDVLDGVVDVPGVVDVRLDDRGQPVVAGHGDRAREAARSHGVGFVEVVEPLPSDEAVAAVVSAAGDEAAVVSVGRSVEGTAVGVDPQRADVEQVAAALGDVAGVVVKEARPARSQSAVGAGAALDFTDGQGNRAGCLTGFAVRDADGGLGWLTAGHCTLDGGADQITGEIPGRGTVAMGSVAFSQFGGPGNAAGDVSRGTDLAVVSAAEGIDAVATVPGGDGGVDDVVASVHGESEPVLGAQVCRYSASAGWGCGEIVEVMVTYMASGPENDRSSARSVTGFMVAGVDAQPGDSGGPVVSGASAVGIVTASSTVLGSDVVYSVPVSDLGRYVPNTHVRRWVPRPEVAGAVLAGPGVATASFAAGDEVSVTVAGAMVDDVEVFADGAAVEVRRSGEGFTFTVPQTWTAESGGHQITVVAVAGGERSLPLVVYVPVEIPSYLGGAWVAHGGAEGDLGMPTGEVDCVSEAPRCFQPFENGRIYGSEDVDPVVIKGRIFTKWLQRREESQVGYPVADEVCGLRDGGCEQKFDDGIIVWSRAHGAFHSRGSMLAKWTLMDRENGRLGYPTGDHTCTSAGGCYQLFTGGALIWSAKHGAVYNGGEIRARYGALGYENGWLGYPVEDMRCGLRAGGCQQTFENGAIWWSPATGARFLKGSILTKYQKVNWENGVLGYPVSDEICGMRDGGCRQDFENGSILWSSATGAHYMRGKINEKYTAVGREAGKLGYPVTDELCGMRAGGCRQKFQHNSGHIYWSPGTGAHVVRGKIMERYAAIKAELEPMGYPTTDEICGLKDGGCFQKFETAENTTHPRAIYYSPAGGTWEVVYAGVLETWAAKGWEKGTYGYPTGQPGVNKYGKYVQKFQGGVIETSKK